MKTRHPLTVAILLLTLVSAFASSSASAGSATWQLVPATGEWNNAVNWSPATVPNGSGDIATFASSNFTDIFCSADTEVNSIVFDPAASAFTITPNPGTTLTISGAGVLNNSAAPQDFVLGVDSSFNHAFLTFSNSATAGNMTTYRAQAATISTYGGTIELNDSANAGSATFLIEGGMISSPNVVGGAVFFNGGPNCSASNATFITEGGTVPGANGGEVGLFTEATGANAAFTNNGGQAEGAQGGFVEVQYGATLGDAVSINNGANTPGAFGGVTSFLAAHAGNSTLIANGGSNGGGGGQIVFFNGSFGDFARVEVFGNGFLDLLNHGDPGVTIGSLEGNGFVSMGPAPLIIGSNNRSTVFAGKITDSRVGGGAVVKIGSGTLVLAGASDYTGATTVRQGSLEVRNRRGSATGSGPVHVMKGRLTGSGIIVGDVTVGSRAGASIAALSPGRKSASPQTLTIQGSLTLEINAMYVCDLNSDAAQADGVVATGATVINGAQISLADFGSVLLPPDTSFHDSHQRLIDGN